MAHRSDNQNEVEAHKRIAEEAWHRGLAMRQPEVDELHAQITTLEWKLSEATKEIERLTLADRQWADHVKRLADERDALRAEVEVWKQRAHDENVHHKLAAEAAEEFRAEVERLRAVVDALRAYVDDASDTNCQRLIDAEAALGQT